MLQLGATNYHSRAAESKNIMRVAHRVLVCIVLFPSMLMHAPAIVAAENTTVTPPPDLLKRVMAAVKKNRDAARSYLWQEDAETVEAGEHHTQKYEWVIVDGVRIRKQIEKDGKPLTGSDARKEEQRIAKAVDHRKHLSAADVRKKEEEERRMDDEVERAFEFHITGEENVNGRRAWVVAAKERPGYHPSNIQMEFISRMHATVWLDQSDYQWSRLEAQVDETVAAAWGLAKLEKGSHFSMQMVRLPEGVWLPQRTAVQGSARIALVKRIPLDVRTTASHFRKVAGEPPVMELRN